MSRFHDFYDFLYYVRQTRFLVGHAFGVSSLPSAAMESIPDWVAKESVSTHTSLPSSTKNVYYEAYTTCLDAAITHLEMVHYGTKSAEASHTTHALHEQTVISLYEPLVSHILAVLEKEVDLLGLFESYYADLVEYEHAYVERYRAAIKELVGALMTLRDVSADGYYCVIHEFSLQEYYGVLSGLKKGVYTTSFRMALDEALEDKHYVDLAAAYRACLELCSRPTHLTYLQQDLRRVQQLITVTENTDAAAKKIEIGRGPDVGVE